MALVKLKVSRPTIIATNRNTKSSREKHSSVRWREKTLERNISDELLSITKTHGRSHLT